MCAKSRNGFLCILRIHIYAGQERVCGRSLLQITPRQGLRFERGRKETFQGCDFAGMLCQSMNPHPGFGDSGSWMIFISCKNVWLVPTFTSKGEKKKDYGVIHLELAAKHGSWLPSPAYPYDMRWVPSLKCQQHLQEKVGITQETTSRIVPNSQMSLPKGSFFISKRIKGVGKFIDHSSDPFSQEVSLIWGLLFDEDLLWFWLRCTTILPSI